jgi:prepilin-type processing-associated H-X9-DG protein
MRFSTIFAILAAILLIGLITSFLLPSGNVEPRTAPRVKSASNLRQIGQAIYLYTQDNRGRFPDTFQDILLNEDIGSEAFVSPLRNETRAVGATTQAVADDLVAGGHLSYVYLGRGLSTETATPNTIIAYEIPVDSASGANLLFGDFHVSFEDAAWMARLISRADAGQFPVTMPSN